ncbi:MAG TPA: TatD family hydrolase [Verrucomicrobiota bacterium]|nr:TatD family hydrolase [Verrucomicrobiota bacterium]
MAIFFDTHAHLDFPEFADDLTAVLGRAREAGIAKIISIGTDLEASRRAVALAERFPDVYAVVGWHPGHAGDAPDDFRAELRALAAHPKVVAIGECGFDFFRLPTRTGTGSAADDAAVRQRQAGVFRQQLEVAAELGLNVVIHTRDSFPETLELFTPFADRVRGVFHCFVGTPSEMEAVRALGSLVSFTGIATFKNGANVRTTLAATPLDGFMLETDCPFLAPVPYRGQRCEPAYVRELAEVVAGVKACSLETLSAATCATARQFFRSFG